MTEDKMSAVREVVENVGMRRIEAAYNAFNACHDAGNQWGINYWGQVYSKLMQTMSA
jgi:hypothetical protein